MTTWEQGPVRWLNRHAVIQLPATVDQSNAELVRQQLQAVVTRDLLVLIVDLSGTTDCDHACGEALAQAYQRAMITGTDLRLVVGAGAVPRLLRITGLDRVVPVYGSMAAAIDATRPADTPPPPADAAAAGRAQRARSAHRDLGPSAPARRSRSRWPGHRTWGRPAPIPGIGARPGSGVLRTLTV
jgi:anti-sigma B factor antagonist